MGKGSRSRIPSISPYCFGWHRVGGEDCDPIVRHHRGPGPTCSKASLPSEFVIAIVCSPSLWSGWLTDRGTRSTNTCGRSQATGPSNCTAVLLSRRKDRGICMSAFHLRASNHTTASLRLLAPLSPIRSATRPRGPSSRRSGRTVQGSDARTTEASTVLAHLLSALGSEPTFGLADLHPSLARVPSQP